MRTRLNVITKDCCKLSTAAYCLSNRRAKPRRGSGPICGRQPTPDVAGGGAAGCTGVAMRRTVTHDGPFVRWEIAPWPRQLFANAFVGKNRCLVLGRRLLTS